MEDYKLLLIGNAKPFPASGFLQHCREQVTRFLANADKVVLISSAHGDIPVNSSELEQLKLTFPGSRWNFVSSPRTSELYDQVCEAEAIIINGNDPAMLLLSLHHRNLLHKIADRAMYGTPCICVGAGAELAGPTLEYSLKLHGHDDFKGLPCMEMIKSHVVTYDPHEMPEMRRSMVFGGDIIALREDQVVEYKCAHGHTRMESESILSHLEWDSTTMGNLHIGFNC